MIGTHFGPPRTFALKLRLLLAPTGRVTVGPNGVVLPIRARELLLPWSTVKTVLERPTLFLLVLSPLSAYFVPRLGMPTTVYEVLHSKAHVVAA